MCQCAVNNSLKKTHKSIMFHIFYFKQFTTVHLQLSASAACSSSFSTCTKTWYQITRMSVCKLSSMVLYGSLLYFVNTKSATSSSPNQCTKLRNPAIFLLFATNQFNAQSTQSMIVWIFDFSAANLLKCHISSINFMKLPS